MKGLQYSLKNNNVINFVQQKKIRNNKRILTTNEFSLNINGT